MSNMTFAWSRAVHAWGGAALALLVLLVSVTGTLLVWKAEYLRLTVPAARIEFEPTPEALARIVAIGLNTVTMAALIQIWIGPSSASMRWAAALTAP